MESASRVAAPASAAFPPCCRILMPAAVAAGLPETTTPWLPTATLGPRFVMGVCVACGHAKDTSKRRETADTEMILHMRDQLRCNGRALIGQHVIKAISTLFRIVLLTNRCLVRTKNVGILKGTWRTPKPNDSKSCN